MNIGIDIEKAERFARTPYNANKEFYRRIFTARELKYCLNKAGPNQCFAARFSAKEAVVKAVGRKINLKDIEITNDSKGHPKVRVKGVKRKIMVSLSHTSDCAAAVALLP